MLRRLFRSCFPRRPPLPEQIQSNAIRYHPMYKYSRNHRAWIGEFELTPDRVSQVLPSRIALLVWNVSFAPPHRRQRLDCIVQHIIESVFSGQDPPPPCVILLQEVHQQALPLLLAHPFIRAHFAVSSVSCHSWPQPCLLGNVTLVTDGIPVYANFTVEFPSTLTARHVTFVDIGISSYHLIQSFSGSESESLDLLGTHSRLRVGNVQLESLINYAQRARPHQLHLLGDFLSCGGLDGGVLGGDIGIMDESEEYAPKAAGLIDTFNGPIGTGMTWGDQPASEIGPKRFDRIYITDTSLVEVTSPRLIGAGLQTRPTSDGPTWASEHCGLLASVEMRQSVHFKHSIASEKN
jgi:tyrosyl-DNA phosphodiesterase 2